MKVLFRILKRTFNDRKTACGVYNCSWIAQSCGLFPIEFGGVVFELGENEKDSEGPEF